MFTYGVPLTQFCRHLRGKYFVPASIECVQRWKKVCLVDSHGLRDSWYEVIQSEKKYSKLRDRNRLNWLLSAGEDLVQEVTNPHRNINDKGIIDSIALVRAMLCQLADEEFCACWFSAIITLRVCDVELWKEILQKPSQFSLIYWFT